MTLFHTKNGDVEISDANPEPEKLAAVGRTREEYEHEFNDDRNWDLFREDLKTIIFPKCAAATNVPAFLGAEIRLALQDRSYGNLVLWINGIPNILQGLINYIEFTDDEKLAVNQAASAHFIGGPVFV